jgi:hypothetical protein
MKKVNVIKKFIPSKIGFSLAWSQKELYALGDDNKPFDFEVYIIDNSGETIETILINVPVNTINDWDTDDKITDFILGTLSLDNLGKTGNRVKINKEYPPKEASKFTWAQVKPYDLENKTLKNDAFEVFVYTEMDNLIFKKEIIVPPMVLEAWDDDDIITNYLLLQLELELDNTVTP